MRSEGSDFLPSRSHLDWHQCWMFVVAFVPLSFLFLFWRLSIQILYLCIHVFFCWDPTRWDTIFWCICIIITYPVTCLVDVVIWMFLIISIKFVYLLMRLCIWVCVGLWCTKKCRCEKSGFRKRLKAFQNFLWLFSTHVDTKAKNFGPSLFRY